MEKLATKTPINITKNEFQIKHNKKKAIIREQAKKKFFLVDENYLLLGIEAKSPTSTFALKNFPRLIIKVQIKRECVIAIEGSLRCRVPISHLGAWAQAIDWPCADPRESSEFVENRKERISPQVEIEFFYLSFS